MKTTKRKGANSTYFGDIIESVKTLSKGLGLTLKHIFEATKRRNNAYVSDKNYFNDKTGLVTLQYPYESLPVPDNGRYRLHNEIDDCIVCDKCAKVCPVDCITIESIKATEEIGKTSDGTSKRLYAPIFDIDLAKCCYCGLCTTVCPTECLTMTKVYDFSEVDVDNFIYKFADMLPHEADQKRKELEIANAQKEAAKAAKAVLPVAKQEPVSASENATFPSETEVKPATPKPAFQPKVTQSPSPEASKEATDKISSAAVPSQSVNEIKAEESAETKIPTARPVFKPKFRPVQTGEVSKPEEKAIPPGDVEKIETKPENFSEEKSEAKTTTPRPVFKPKMKPVIPSVNKEALPKETEKGEEGIVASGNIQSTVAQPEEQKESSEDKQEAKPAATRPAFRPKIRPQKPTGDNNQES